MTAAPTLQAWLLATRPRTLAAALVPVLVGSAAAYAAGGFRAAPALAALGGAIALQIAANYANDAADFERGADGPDRVGPKRAAASGMIAPRALKLGALAALALALAFGVYLARIAGPAVVVIGALSMIAAVAYTTGPFPLAYHGLGELFVIVFFGFVAVTGTAFVVLGRVPFVAWPAALSIGAVASALLVVNNLRDRKSDARAGKRTLAVRYGERFTVREYASLLAIAYFVPLALSGIAGAAMLLPLLSLPLALPLVKTVATVRGAALNAVLAKTARLLFVFGVLLAAGIALAEGS